MRAHRNPRRVAGRGAAALLAALVASVLLTTLPAPAEAQGAAPKITRDECIRHGRFVVEVARVCEAAYGLCSNPPSAAWRNGPNVKLACDQVAHEQRLRNALHPKPDVLAAPRPLPPGVGPQPASPSLLQPAPGLQPPPGRP